jgi:hypothetical protein
MTTKKLTLAAAIAVGIAACSLNPATAACPCSQKPTTVNEAPCPAEPLPVVTGPSCPVEEEKPLPKCNKCKEKKEKCKCKEKKEKKPCGCPDKGDETGYAAPLNPAISLCPVTGKPSRKDMLQVYGYPNAIYGANNYIGEPAASVATVEAPYTAYGSPRDIAVAGSGVTVSTDGELTGAAAQLPCLNGAPERYNGIPINRDDKKMDSSNPIDFQSSNSIDAVRKSFVPFTYKEHIEGIETGAAAGIPTSGCQFPDVPNSFWASCDIDKLAINDVVVGYPDGYFRPNRDISRAEFATMLVKGFNLSGDYSNSHMFKDVPAGNWAHSAISKAAEENLLAGYPNGTYKPNSHVTRAEALSSISKGMTCSIDQGEADDILSKYIDGNSVPGWAKIPIAKSLKNGALKDMPNPSLINPNNEATRADVSSMLQTVRVALGYDTNPKTANSVCPACPIEKSAYMETEEIVKIPTLKVQMIDQITAKSSHIGQYFRANTLEDISINGTNFPCGSTVTGQVVEVIRPSGCDKGAIKLSFTEIKNDDCKAKLPKQILSAQINQPKQVNPVARLVEAPFTLVGSILGVAGRTVGGAVTNLGNAAENVVDDGGYMLGHIFQGKPGAAARSLGDGLWETVKAPVDITRTALAGTVGLFETTGDEVAYLVNPSGYKISAVNPREQLTVAFGCTE